MFAIVLFLTFLSFIVDSRSSLAFTPVLYELDYNKNYTFKINKSVEYVLEFNNTNIALPPRIWIHSSNASISVPLMIVAQQPREMLSWQLPFVVESESGDKHFMTTSRTLCHDVIKHNKISGMTKAGYENPIVTVSTDSSVNVNFTVNVHYQEDFYINHSQEYNFTISPNEPRYYFYNFTTNITLEKKDSNYETVILEVSSDDDICMTVSIQNASCPVFDTNQDITFRGFYETVSRKGGITIPKYKFPYGFYVVFVAKADDFDCTGIKSLPGTDTLRTKNISLIIKPSITYKDYINAVIFTLGTIGTFYVIFILAFCFCSVKFTIPRQMEYVPENHTPTPTSSNQVMLDSISIDEIEYDLISEIENDRELRLCRGRPCLTDLARKDPRILNKKSYLYLYNVLTIAVFYGLPVVQLVVTYQRMLNETGQQDLCFYNFLCAHPLGVISDFNHLFSNIGYVLLGILFLIITYCRELSHKDIVFDRHFGIPQHYGMFYAMGVALIMEGILSGSYHVCPNQSNFQFDSSFMYVMAVLCMVKLYQNRHPDINATAYSTFGALAVAILLGLIGILDGKLYFWIIFIVIYILTCFYISTKIYYMGCWKLSKVSVQRIYRVCIYDFWSGPLNILKPCYTDRFVLLLLGNFCNWALAFFALYYHPPNFAIFLLAIFMSNTLLYFFFYVVMKYLHKERVRIITWLYLILSTICATSAMYFFLHKSISWSKTAAQSRKYNMECSLLRFYDFHDIWHFLSAMGMFFTFMVLLTLDDDLSHTQHSQIPVF